MQPLAFIPPNRKQVASRFARCITHAEGNDEDEIACLLQAASTLRKLYGLCLGDPFSSSAPCVIPVCAHCNGSKSRGSSSTRHCVLSFDSSSMLADSDNTGRVPARPLSPVSITARKLRSALRIDGTDPTDGLRHEQMAAALQSGWKRLGGAIPGLEAITEQAGSSVETRLPSPFLPAFEGSVEPLDGSDKPITSLSPGPLESPPRTAQQQGSPGLSQSSRLFALNAFTSSDPSVPGDSESKLVRAGELEAACRSRKVGSNSSQMQD